MNKKYFICFRILFFIILSLSVISCGSFFSGEVCDDLSELRPMILTFAKENGIKDNELYYILPDYLTKYIAGLEETETGGDTLRHFRSLAQLIYFDSLDNQISYNSTILSGLKFPYVNLHCNWNSTRMYDSFPPTDFYDSPVALEMENDPESISLDSPESCKFIPIIGLNKDSILSYMRPLLPNSQDVIDTIDYDYYVFMLGTVMFSQGSTKHQIGIVNKNIALDTNNSKIKRYFIMTLPMTDTTNSLIPYIMDK